MRASIPLVIVTGLSSKERRDYLASEARQRSAPAIADRAHGPEGEEIVGGGADVAERLAGLR